MLTPKKVLEIREGFQKYADDGIWQGENEYTKNFPIGNINNYWLGIIQDELRIARESFIKEITMDIIYACAEYTNMHQDTDPENIAVNTVRSKIFSRLEKYK